MSAATATATAAADKEPASKVSSPPPPLPQLWVMKESRSRPGYRYCFNQVTGECRWTVDPEKEGSKDSVVVTDDLKEVLNSVISITKKDKSSPSKSKSSSSGSSMRKRSRQQADDEGSSAKRSSPPQVRVLHILKKHRGSRRPASWRNPKITDSKEKATEDLKELLEILREVQEDPKELRATFEELAKTESDCSSAKRGGDLGFFGRKKMQPPFEHASFGLDIGKLSDVVESSSGMHLILRIG